MKRLFQTTEVSTSPMNLRRKQRVSASLPMTLTWMTDDGVRIQDRAVVENISEAGALIRTRIPIPASAQIRIAEPMTLLSAEARVVRTTEPNPEGLSRIGIEFTGGLLIPTIALLVSMMFPFTSAKASPSGQELPATPVVQQQASYVPNSVAAAILPGTEEPFPEMYDPAGREDLRGTAPPGALAEEIEMESAPSEGPLAGIPRAAAVVLPPSPEFSKFVEPRSETRSWQAPLDRLKKIGITFQISETADWSKNFRGGESTKGSALRHLLKNSVSMESDILGWNGGLFFASAQIHAGRNGSLQLGEFQGFSNIDAEARNDIAQMWFQQTFFGKKVRVKAGKADANTEFAFVENAADFLNSSMGFSPTIVDFPTYPSGRMSVNVFAYPGNGLYGGFGWYDLEGGGSMFIAEGGKRWASGAPARAGRLGVGVWDNTADHIRFDGQTQQGTRGFYLVLDQALWSKHPEREDSQGIRSFLQYGYADAKLSQAVHHIGGGVVWSGAIPGRDRDELGVGATMARLSQEPGAGFDYAHELALETFYKISILPWMQIAPGFQYIRHPGGAAALGNAVVGTVRLTFVFDSALLPSGAE